MAKWMRKDREHRVGGAVAACFKHSFQSQEIDVMLPQEMEPLFFRVVLNDNIGLLCVMYCPSPVQRRSALDFLTEKLDTTANA